MLNLSIEVDPLEFPDAGQVRKATASALKIWGVYFGRRLDQRFKSEGPGWAPRAATDDAIVAARQKSVSSLAEHRLRGKLVRELQRARSRIERGKGTFASVARRAAVLKEFDRQSAGGAVGVGSKLAAGSKEQALAALSGKTIGSKALQKSVAGLRERRARAEVAAATRVLGRIPSSIKRKQGRGVLEVKSQIEWSGVQNEGGQVGNNATLPARPFMYLESEDVNVLVEIVNNRLAAAFGVSE